MILLFFSYEYSVDSLYTLWQKTVLAKDLVKMLLVSCWKNNKILQKLKSKQTRTWYIYSSWNVKGVSIVFVTEKWYVDDFDLKISKTKSQIQRLDWSSLF